MPREFHVLFSGRNELQGWAAFLARIQREGEKTCHGRIRKEREAFPFSQLNPRVKEETRHGCVCVCSIPRAHSSSSRRLEPAPLKASPDTLTGTFSLRFQGFWSQSCSSTLIPSTQGRWSTGGAGRGRSRRRGADGSAISRAITVSLS